jgi:hypothetical protein
MPIPSVKSGQSEQEYVSECISAIYDEYGQETSAAICYNTYRKSNNLSASQKVASKLKQQAYRGIDITKLEEGGLENACWDGWKALGTKILDGKTVPNCIREEDHPDFK